MMDWYPGANDLTSEEEAEAYETNNPKHPEYTERFDQ